MTLQLKYAAAIAAAGTISEAAQALSIAQPSLTNAMKKLETELGIRIFMRTNKGVVAFSGRRGVLPMPAG